MAVRPSSRLSVRVALPLVLLATPNAISAQDAAQVSTDSDFYRAVMTTSSPASTSKNSTPEPLLGDKAPETNALGDGVAAVPSAAPTSDLPGAPTASPRRDQRLAVVAWLLSVSTATWATLILSITVGGFLLWVATPMPCLLLGHRRNKARVRFSDQHQKWVGNCKRCNAPMVRDAAGRWKSAKVGRLQSSPPSPRVEQAPTFVFAPERKAVQAETERQSVRAKSVASSLVEDVSGGSAPTPNTRGALFSVVDDLRARLGPDESTLCDEKISIRMQQLESALQRGEG